MASITCRISSARLFSNNIISSKPSPKLPPCSAFFPPSSRYRKRLLPVVRAEANKDDSVDINRQNKDGGATPPRPLERRPSATKSPSGLVDSLSSMRNVYIAAESNTRSPYDIEDKENEIKMRFDVPGFSKDDLTVMTQGHVLEIKGPDNTSLARIDLPNNCDKDKIKVGLKHGVLFISIPKLKAERKEIDVDIN